MSRNERTRHRPTAAVHRTGPVRTPRRAAFTVVEILVVLGVVVTILALVSTGLSNASAASRGTACRSNLRQLHIAAESYLATQGGYPAAILHHVIDGGVRTTTWDFEHRPDGTIVEGPIWTHLGGGDRVF
ncbi:MAG: type II secretion system protein, partial [Phycisphaeraceae bacterium]|nr:type II secretion system protein [Phycisphaeraceae bacterium]